NISKINISGIGKLEVTVKADFSDSLKHIVIEPIFDPMNEGIPRVETDLKLDKAGSGGGEFYKLLSALNDPSAYGGII
ncbi:hypothetical protein, partial [Staphylococcus aureus]